MTRFERSFVMVVKETTSARPSSPNAASSDARAPSDAKPLPQCLNAMRQPISTHGMKGASKEGTERPTKPISSSLAWTSTAQKPKPRFVIASFRRVTIASLSARVRTLGKCCITRGSAFNSANGARSLSRHERRTRRGVRRFVIARLTR